MLTIDDALERMIVLSDNGSALARRAISVSRPHDAGIVRGPGGSSVVIAVLTWDTLEHEGIELIKKIVARLRRPRRDIGRRIGGATAHQSP